MGHIKESMTLAQPERASAAVGGAGPCEAAWQLETGSQGTQGSVKESH